MSDHLAAALKRGRAALPHLRAGQLILNALSPNHVDLEDLDLWQVTDDQLAERIDDYTRIAVERNGA